MMTVHLRKLTLYIVLLLHVTCNTNFLTKGLIKKKTLKYCDKQATILWSQNQQVFVQNSTSST